MEFLGISIAELKPSDARSFQSFLLECTAKEYKTLKEEKDTWFSATWAHIKMTAMTTDNCYNDNMYT